MNRKIRKAAVIGSGVMGGGIAALLAGAGVKTMLLDIVPFDLKEDEKNDPQARNRIAKAGLDAVELRKKYGQRLGICGNSNIQIWETGDEELIRKEVLRKLNAAKGGGYIFQSDHSVASNVSGKTYDYIIKLVREYGQYPLKPGEYDECV